MPMILSWRKQKKKKRNKSERSLGEAEKQIKRSCFESGRLRLKLLPHSMAKGILEQVTQSLLASVFSSVRNFIIAPTVLHMIF